MVDVALIYQPAVEESLPLAETCAQHAEQRGFSTALISSRDLETERAPDGVRFAITFGGDGTILRAARWLDSDEAIVLGVQMGRLGFLAEVKPADLPGALDPYLDGNYWVDRRAMLQAEAERPATSTGDGAQAGDERAPVARFLALNDIVVGRGQALRTVTVDVFMEDHLLQRFRADGVIVASATGSTAYSFAAGGPVLPPDSADVVVTAICPHISTLRSMVLPGEVPLKLQVWTDDPATLTVDGQQDLVLNNGQAVETRLCERTTKFARRGTRGEFYSRILAKLQSH
jgi:NAD+ kinase